MMKIRKKATALLVIAVSLFVTLTGFSPTTAQAASIPSFEEAVIVAEDVNMRLRPTVDSPFVLKLKNGTRVGVFCEEVDGWYRIIYGNYRGYVSKDYVFLPSTDVLVGNIIHDDTPVYRNAGEFSDTIDTLSAGVGVTIISMQREYYHIEYPDEEAIAQQQQQESQQAKEATADEPEEEQAQGEEEQEPTAERAQQSEPDETAEAPEQTPEDGDGEAAAEQEQPEQTPEDAGQPEEDSVVDFTPQVTDEQPAENMKRGYITRDSVKTSTSKNAANMIKEGMRGVEVMKMQRELQQRGFLLASATGEFGELTKEAVTTFQEFAGLAADGVAGAKTLELLYADNDIRITYAQRMGLSDPIQLVPWNEVDANYIPKETIYKVMDVQTGITWNEYRFGGWYHSDTVPVTKEDTENMKRAVGDWTWERRPIWIIMDDINIAASMNCMPHLSNPKPENGFGGHHCIHFYQSKVHETSRECPRHAAQVQYAYKKGQES